MSGEIRYTSACGACGPAVQSRASCVGEFGDEWAYSDYGSCGDCSFNCVSFGLLGDACTAGTRAKCKHISYLGDKSSCCLGLGPGANTKNTCNPAYSISNSECDSTYNAYCSVGDRIISDPICKNWRNIRPQQARQVLQNYCVAHMDSPECRTWCKSIADGGDGACDEAVQGWCNSHPDDPYCACVKSPLRDPKYGINPKCNDRKCIDTGYVSANMRNTACPDITNCDVQMKMLNSGIQLSGVTINQSCGGSPTDVGAAPDHPPSLLTADDTAIYLFIFIVIVILAVLVAYLYYSSREDSSRNT